MNKIKKRTRKQQVLVNRLINEQYISYKDMENALKSMSAYERADWAVSQSKSNWKERWV